MGKYDALFADETKPAKGGKYSALFDDGQDQGYVPPLSPEQQAANVTKARQDAVKELPGTDRRVAGFGRALAGAGMGLAQLGAKATDALHLTQGAGDKVTQAWQPERDLYDSATKGDINSRIGEVAGNLTLGAAIPTGGIQSQVAKLGGKLPGFAAKALTSKAGSAMIGQGLEGAAQGATQFVGEGESRAQNAAIGGTIGAAIPGAIGAAKVAGQWTNKLLGKAAQELSGVSEEALRTYGAGFSQGAKDIRAASGTQAQIGEKLVKMVDNLDDYLPEKQIVDQALKVMPSVNVANTIRILEGTKTGGVLSSSRNTNTKIAGIIDDLKAAADADGNIPAQAFREIRKEIDSEAGDAFGKESNKYITALKMARHQMADDLTQTAKASGNEEYASAMASMANKLRKADDLKSFLGKSAQTREQRAESFVSTLFGKNKDERRKAVEAMGEIFGQDFLQESKLAHLAAELGDGGKPSILPRQFTGRSALGPILSGGLVASGGGPSAIIPTLLSSPRLAAGALGAADATGRQANRLAPIIPPLSRQLQRQSIYQLTGTNRE